ncbi:MAG: TonB-dependent receptor [Acidobacteria bacterium]|nr:TonB-dependent receptor [Acidobacteriota bacterium]
MRPSKRSQKHLAARLVLCLALAAQAFPSGRPAARAQDTVTGAFEGVVRDRQTGAGVGGASVEIIAEESDLRFPTKTDTQGYFYYGALNPGSYTIRVSRPGYLVTEIKSHELSAVRTTPVVPRPVELEKLSADARPRTRRRTYADTLVVFLIPVGLKQQTQTPAQTRPTQTTLRADEALFRGTLFRGDTRRDGSFGRREVTALPLGSKTLTRTYDELAFLLPGVAPPPETIGNGSGPGVGAGVGSAGQFAVNGLRSRANNFTVDGSDNNDEDIGVRRQGFFALVPQPVESLQEYQVTTLLAPAQFGRNLGAQVNAVSRSGGNDLHGSLYGLFNSSQLNARNFFDTANGDAVSALRFGGRPVVSAPGIDFGRDFRLGTLSYDPPGVSPVLVRNGSGGRDSFTLGQGGFVLGGPLVRGRLFYLISAEGQLLNATREESFAVPTVAERGAFGTGASGLLINPFDGSNVFAFPTTRGGDAVFSLFPFANNPSGVYGPNTFTETLPAGARGQIYSGKLDTNFQLGGRPQTFAARYNFTDDRRDLPSAGGALFSSLRARVRTQNLSLFLNSKVSAPASTTSVFNQLRLSYGRTRLRFEELRDGTYLLPSERFPDTPFLLNAARFESYTLPGFDSVNNRLVPNAGPVLYQRSGTVEDVLGPIGQVNVAGYSPVGVDVFNFPQRRVNNTYQWADHLTVRAGRHNFAFGTDDRRTELNSVLPRNFRPLLSFQGAPRLVADSAGRPVTITRDFVAPATLAAAGAASGFSETLTTGSDGRLNLRFYQFNFYGQDEWRVRPDLSLSLGLRYEYNTPPREVNRRIEETFGDPAVGSLVPGLSRFIDGRERIYDPDRDNFSPRVGLAYSPRLFGPKGSTVLRAGYGHFNDQILGAVVSQSRNVFPNFVTVNTPGGLGNLFYPNAPLSLLNPAVNLGGVQALNRIDRASLPGLIRLVNCITSTGGLGCILSTAPVASGVEVTLPARRLQMPGAHHYSLSFEQRLGADTILSAAYVGTRGQNLLRFTTPNLGSNAVSLVSRFDIGTGVSNIFEPLFFGVAVPPGTRVSGLQFTGGRPVPDVGGVSIFETTARSRYDAAQLGLRGLWRGSLRYDLNYTFSKALDDVSDVFDLAGAPALPQDSFDLGAEYGPSNYDARHLLSYSAVFDVPGRGLFEGLQLASTGYFRTGQPFTVNSIFDVNLDGNLTDRLDTTGGLVVTGDRLRPLLLTTSDTAALLAPVGEDGSVGRNTFRAGSVFEINLALVKAFRFDEARSFLVRTEFFNLTNRANFGVPVRLLEAPAFGRATSTLTPGRRVQFFLKYVF